LLLKLKAEGYIILEHITIYGLDFLFDLDVGRLKRINDLSYCVHTVGDLDAREHNEKYT
jgi:hypothetical protein